MSKLSIRRKGRKILIVCLPAAGDLRRAAMQCLPLSGEKSRKRRASSNYKEETVRRGSVSAGISESGTIAYGTTEQGFLHGRGDGSIGFFVGFLF